MKVIILIIRSYESQIIDLANKERRARGLSPLQADSELTQVARIKAQDMAGYQIPNHGSPTLGGDEFHQLRNANLSFSYNIGAANILWGSGKQFTPEEIIKSWMESTEGHREAILDPNFTHVGVGYDYSPNARNENSASMILIGGRTPIQKPTPPTGWVQVGDTWYHYDSNGTWTGESWRDGKYYFSDGFSWE